MTDPLDSAPDDAFDAAFQLPEVIVNDASLRALHAEIVTRLRREAAGLPMSTVQNLILERLATLYVWIKYKERTGGFTDNQQKEFNKDWLDLAREFNKLLMAHQDKLREAMLIELQSIVIEGSKLIKDDEDRRQFRLFLSEKFAEQGQ